MFHIALHCDMEQQKLDIYNILTHISRSEIVTAINGTIINLNEIRIYMHSPSRNSILDKTYFSK